MTDPTVSITTTKRSSQVLFDDATETRAREVESEKFWASLEPVRRSVVMVVVRDCLLRMVDQIDGWLPTGLEPDGQDWLDINLRVQLPELDEVTVRIMQEGLRNRRDALETLIAIEKETR